MKLLVVIVAAALLFTACQTCNDYRNDPLGPPPGCECLNSVYGCGPFDDPDWYKARAAQPLRATVRPASKRDLHYQLELSRTASDCMYPLQQTVAGAVIIDRRGKTVWLQLSSTLVVKGRVKGRTLQITHAGAARGCGYMIKAETKPFPGADSPIAALVELNCAGQQCKAEYGGFLRRR